MAKHLAIRGILRIFSDQQLFYIIFILIIILNLSVFSSQRLYPFTDLPNHLAAATILKYYNDDNNNFSDYYQVNSLLCPNTSHLIFCSLKIFPSVETANRFYFALYIILLPVSILMLIKFLNGDKWLSFLSFMLIYNFNVTWGFVGFMLSIPFVLLVLYFLLRDFQQPGYRNIIAIVILFCLLYFIHLLALLFALSMYLIYSFWIYRKEQKKLIIIALPAIIMLVLIGVLLVIRYPDGIHKLTDYLYKYYIDSFLTSFLDDRILLLFCSNYGLFDGFWGHCVSGMFSLPIFVFAIICFKKIKNVTGLKSFFRRYLPVTIFLILSVFYAIFLPSEVPGNQFLFQRFTVFFLLALILFGSIGISKINLKAKLLVVGMSVIHLLLWADLFHEFNNKNIDFNASFFRDHSNGERLAALIYEPDFRGIHSYVHFPDYYIVWNRGIATTAMIDYRFSNISRKADKVRLPVYIDWISWKYVFYDDRYENFNKIFVRGDIYKRDLRYFEDYSVKRIDSNWRVLIRPDSSCSSNRQSFQK